MITYRIKVVYSPVYTRTYKNLEFRWKNKEIINFLISAENKLKVLKQSAEYVQCTLYYQKEFLF
jgi:hypothetical protein